MDLTTLGTFTVDTGTDEIILNGHGRYDGSRVQFTSTGTLPAGLSPATTYYCLVTSANRFQVSLTEGGAAVDITDAGTGVHTCLVEVDGVEKGLLTYGSDDLSAGDGSAWSSTGAEKGLLTYGSGDLSAGDSSSWMFSAVEQGLITKGRAAQSAGDDSRWMNSGAEQGLLTFGSTPSELEAIIPGGSVVSAELEVSEPPTPPNPGPGPPPEPLPAATERLCSTCIPEPCKTVDDLALYSLNSPIFPFVLNCPPGSTCNPANVVLLACCDEDVPVTIPQNANDAAAMAALQRALADCARKQLFCGELTELPTPGHPITVFFNDAVTRTATCPDGSVFSYTLRAGTVVGLSRASANRAAGRLASQRAVEHRLCLSPLDGAICLDVAYSRTLRASGRYVALFPASDLWTHISGTLPTGLSFAGGFHTNGATLSGTPTVAGTYTFTIRFVVSTFGSLGYGDFMEKTYELKVVGITTASPLPDYTSGEFYSEAIDISGSHDIDLETWRISSGNLPDGFTLSKRLISGTTEAMMTGFMFTVEVTFTVQVILRNGFQGFKQVTCSKAFVLEDGAEDLGTVTPDITSAAASFFDSGNPQPPGRYRIEYENGAMQYAACMPDPCWSVNTIGAGFRYRYFAPGLTDALFPASTNAFLTQPAAEAENAGLFVDFDTTVSAAISMYLSDTNYTDNQAGTPNPTFRLFRLSLA